MPAAQPVPSSVQQPSAQPVPSSVQQPAPCSGSQQAPSSSVQQLAPPSGSQQPPARPAPPAPLKDAGPAEPLLSIMHGVQMHQTGTTENMVLSLPPVSLAHQERKKKRRRKAGLEVLSCLTAVRDQPQHDDLSCPSHLSWCVLTANDSGRRRREASSSGFVGPCASVM